MAELFRQIKRSVAELFRQIKRSVGEQFRQIKRSVAEHFIQTKYSMEEQFWKIKPSTVEQFSQIECGVGVEKLHKKHSNLGLLGLQSILLYTPLPVCYTMRLGCV